MRDLALVVSVLACSSGCPAEDGGGSGDTHDSEASGGGSGNPGSSGDHGSEVDHGTGDPTPTSDASTGHAHDEDSTGRGHDSGSTSHDRGTESTDGGAEGDTGDPALAQEWCDCMITACHDLYHRTFGDQHPDSERNCLAAGSMVPTNGSPTESGNSIECRIHFCGVASEGDESACESAIGGGTCM